MNTKIAQVDVNSEAAAVFRNGMCKFANRPHTHLTTAAKQTNAVKCMEKACEHRHMENSAVCRMMGCESGV